MRGMQYEGEFEIKQAQIFSPDGEATDLLTDFQLIEINLFEDMFKSAITGNAIVIDTRDIISKIPLIGQERLSLKIATPSLTKKEDIIDFTENHFFVHKIAGRQEVSSGGQTYQIQFVSNEAIKIQEKEYQKHITILKQILVR